MYETLLHEVNDSFDFSVRSGMSIYFGSNSE
jgi:hypothetical protein